MEIFNCPICKEPYNKNSRKVFLLSCGHSACYQCIKFYEDLGKEIMCEVCCNMSKPLNFENKAAYSKIMISINGNDDEFEIFIKKKNDPYKFSIVVKRGMTLGELKKKIKEKEDIDFSSYGLGFKRPLTDDSKTLESYGIINTCTLSIILW